MKLFKFTFFIGLMTASMVFSSCKKEEKKPADEVSTTGTNLSNSNSQFSAKVDGLNFDYNDFSAFVYSAGNGEKISMTATAINDYPSMSIFIPSDIQVGSYDFKGQAGETEGTYRVSSDFADTFHAADNAGSLIISSHNLSTKVVIGTFEFVAVAGYGNSSTDTYTISEGSFTVKY